MGEVSLDDIQLALVPVSKKSASVYKSVVILYKSIFRAAMESRIIDHNPTIYLTTKGGGVPQEDRQALTDEQAARLLDAIRDLPPYVFVMIGLYAGLRREEILALQWDSVYLDLAPAAPYTAPKIGESLKDPMAMYLGDIYTVAVNLCGLPGITVPCGKDSAGLPIGIQMIGDCFMERKILRAAHAYESVRGDFGTPEEGGKRA